MGRNESEKTIIKRRRSINRELDIAKRLADEAREKAKDDPKLFTEYLALDIYNEMMLDTDKQTRYKAAKDMLAFTLAKKRPQWMGGGKEGEEGKKLFTPNLPVPKEKTPIPEHIQLRIHSIKEANSKK
jgi:hypothetical protein